MEPGPYSGDNYDREAIKKEIDQISKNENTSHYAQSQHERVNELFEIEKKARNLTKIEEEHLDELVAYWNETLSEGESKQRILTIQAGKKRESA